LKVCGKQFNRSYAKEKAPLTSILSPEGRGRKKFTSMRGKEQGKQENIKKKTLKPALLKGFQRWRAVLKRWLWKPLINKGFRVS
jgi:peptide subunit release factor 1 (eRF1)